MYLAYLFLFLRQGLPKLLTCPGWFELVNLLPQPSGMLELRASATKSGCDLLFHTFMFLHHGTQHLLCMGCLASFFDSLLNLDSPLCSAKVPPSLWNVLCPMHPGCIVNGMLLRASQSLGNVWFLCEHLQRS